MLSFGIRIIGLLDLGRVLRCYVVRLGKIQILLFYQKKNDLKGADVPRWEGISLRCPHPVFEELVVPRFGGTR